MISLDSLDQQAVRKNIERRVAQQLQDLGTEFRRGHKAYLAKLKGQTIEEYRPDLSFSEVSSSERASGAGFFDDEPHNLDSCDHPLLSAPPASLHANEPPPIQRIPGATTRAFRRRRRCSW